MEVQKSYQDAVNIYNVADTVWRVKDKDLVGNYKLNYKDFNFILFQMSNLTKIVFSNSFISSNYLNPELISEFTKITALTLKNTEMLNNNDCNIAALSNLTYFDIYKGGIVITNVDNLVNLRTLKLSYEVISQEALNNISQLTCLTELKLVHNPLINRIDAIAEVISLTKLDLSNNHIDNISSISKLTSLTELNLYNDVKIEDISFIAMLNNIKVLNIGNTSSTKESLSCISNLVNLQKLNVSRIKIENFNFFNWLMLAKLKFLDISHNEIVDINDVTYLTNLEELNASYTSIRNTFPLSFLSNLAKLDLSYTFITDEIFPNISHLLQLKNLDCSNSAVEVGKNISRLPPRLYTINLSHLRGIKDFNVTALSQVRKLNLSFSFLLESEIVEIFNNLSQLEKLNLSYIPINNKETFKSISNLINLKSLNLACTFMFIKAEVLQYFSGLTTLESLDLCSNDITHEHVIMHLFTLTNLRELNVENTNVTSELYEQLYIYFPNLHR